MEKKYKLIFFIIIILISNMYGCTSKNIINSEDVKLNPKGFKEEVVSIDNIFWVNDIIKMENNELKLYGEDKERGALKFESDYSGINWTEENMELKVKEDVNIYGYRVSSKGDILLYTSDKDNNVVLKVIKKDGDIIDLQLSNFENKNHLNAEFDYKGDILVYDNEEVVSYSIKNGKAKKTYKLDSDGIISICSTEDYLIVATATEVLKYNLSNPEEVCEIDILKEYVGYKSFLAAESGNIIYFASEKGLYKYNLDNNDVSQVLDSSLCSLGDANYYINGVFIIDKENFYIQYYSNNGPVLYKYTYSKDLAYSQVQELKVYSLYEDNFISQCVLWYQRKNQDIRIKYEIGVTKDSGVTESDAIKTLNTEIMAGNGPDILFLDKLSYDNYIEKGLLLDISKVIEDNKNQLYTNIINSFYEQDNLYTVPLRVEVPIVIGNDEKVDKVNDVATLIENLEISLDMYEAIDFINYLFYTSSNNLTDTTINSENLKLFLQNVRLAYKGNLNEVEDIAYNYYSEMMGNLSSNEIRERSKMSFLESGIYITKLMLPDSKNLDLAYIKDFREVVDIYSASKVNTKLKYKDFTTEEGNIFLPKGLVAISSRANNKEEAGKFIIELLGESFQSNSYDNGLPVNKIAFLKNYEANIANTNLGAFGTNGIMCDRLWPTEEEYNKINDIIEKLNKPIMPSNRLLDVVTESGEKYLEDIYTIDQAIDEIINKLDLYYKE